MITVVHHKNASDVPVGTYYMYIGRPSAFGNLYIMRGEAERSRVIEYVEGNRNAMQAIKRLRKMHQIGVNIALGCWCAPKPCHGDVIKELIER